MVEKLNRPSNAKLQGKNYLFYADMGEFYQCLLPVRGRPGRVTIFLMENSTVADKSYRDGNPEKGWGQVFPLYFLPVRWMIRFEKWKRFLACYVNRIEEKKKETFTRGNCSSYIMQPVIRMDTYGGQKSIRVLKAFKLEFGRRNIRSMYRNA